MMLNIIFFAVILFLLPAFFLIRRGGKTAQRLPPGSLGLSYIGQSLSLLRVMRANTAEAWFQERINKYGPISKLSLFGKPTVFIYGQAANKFVFCSDSNKLGNQQNEANKRILGDRNLLELSGEDHKRVRKALVSFLKPESLKEYVGKMDEEVRRHIKTNWEGKETVKVLPLMKTLTFDMICSLLFGVGQGARRDKLVENFGYAIQGVWSLPINLPFTRYNRSLQASARIRNILKELIHEKRVELEQNGASSHQDLITSLLSIRDEDNKQVVSEDEIVHNTTLLMIAGYDTSSVLLTFMVRLLANDPNVYQAYWFLSVCPCLYIYGFLISEQEEIARNKAPDELLTWEDTLKMKYTWRVAMETLRMIPPVFGGFRKVLQDIEFGGYVIPKGWQIFWTSNITHMDSDVFPEPSKFDPARFENQSSIPPYYLIPFGGGARICPGYEFVKIETLVAIHYLVTRFTWKLACNDDSFSRDPMPVPAQGLPIQITSKKLP